MYEVPRREREARHAAWQYAGAEVMVMLPLMLQYS
jgi:hypothetical protein